MKKVLFITCFLFSISAFSQSKNYSEKWSLINSLEIEGRIETADSLVREIMAVSNIKRDYPNFIKSKIYHYKFYQINHENSNQYILDDLNDFIETVPHPYKNIVYSYKGKILLQYLQENRWQIRNRTKLEDSVSVKIETWSPETLQDSIESAFVQSFQNEKKLQKTEIEEIAALIDPDVLNRKYKPTIFDLISYNALEYYNNSSNFTNVHPKEQYIFESEKLYSDSKIFQTVSFPEISLETPNVKSLRIFQKLGKFHAQDKNPEAAVFAHLKRLEFVNTFYVNENKWDLYFNALDELAVKYENQSVRGLILLEKAKLLHQLSEEKKDEKLLHPDYLKKAVLLTENIIKNYPNSSSALDANKLKSSIQSPQFSAKAPEILTPSTAGRIFISYKSLDSINIKYYRVQDSFGKNQTYSGLDSLINNLVHTPPLFQNTFDLPKSEDYNRHSTEIVIPSFKNGYYLIYIAEEGKGTGYSYNFLQVTNISVAETIFDEDVLYETFNRTTGEKIGKVKLEFLDNNHHPSGKIYTDNEGRIRETKTRSHSILVRASKDGDTLRSYSWIGYNYRYKEDETYPMAKTLFYLDRAIYRPGQKVYFKGILLQNENKKTTTVPNEYVEIYVDDANGNEIEFFRLKTNKHGSFNGEFTLPTSGITGEFHIYTEEDIDSETKFWDKIWGDGDYYDSGIYFSVEEYKRPTFEVIFEENKESLKFNDSVRVTGNASSFMGAKLSNIQVEYEIFRQQQRYSWRRSFESPILIAKDTITTDADGNFDIDFLAEVDKKSLKNKNLIYTYTINATVTDLNGETRSASTSLKIGNKNLLANFSISEKVKISDSLNTQISATNLNGINIPFKGSLKIYKLKGPDRVLRNRMWEAPEINMISEEEFKKLFPEEPYLNPKPADEWPKDELIHTAEFDTQTDSFTSEIPVSVNWKSGKYVAEAVVTNGIDTDSISRIFSVTNPNDKFLPDNGRFQISILNSDFSEDGFVKALVQTGYSDLRLKVSAFAGFNTIFEEYLNVTESETIVIPLNKVTTEEVKIIFSAIINNSAISEEKQISLKTALGSLTIETETFRNKISPGTEETWSFKIFDESGAVPDAEILASMYDLSLDQFKTQNWETNPGFYERAVRFPQIKFFNLGKVNNFLNKNYYYPSFTPIEQNFDRLRFYGFHFSQKNSYQYRRYLSKMYSETKRISSDLDGNTRGRVTDDTGMPLPGVNVVIKGTKIGTQTDFDGEFGIDTKPGDVLVFSLLGMKSKEYSVGKEKEIYLPLEPDSSQLESVVVTALGVTRSDAERYPVAYQLTGKVAGLQIENEGSDAKIILRGKRSISGGNQALIVLNGKIVTAESLQGLSPEDFISTEILKAEQGAALYGSQGANGVIIITTKNGLAELSQVQARTNLNETAFFLPSLTLDKDGKVKFSFTSPEALTRWKLRLLAHTNDWTTGKLEQTVVTQKELNLLPNPPRFLREGDTINFKTKISNLTDETMTGNAVLYLFDALNMQPIDTILGNTENLKPFSIKAKGNTSVSWEIIVPEGIQAVTYRVLAKAGDFSDGEENLLPVLTNRMLVKQSLPLFVRAGETETFEFENLKNNTSSTLKNHQFTLEYSSNPAWFAIQSLPYLMEFPHECSEQIFSRLYANSLAAHIINSQPKIKEVLQEWKKDSLVSMLGKNEDLKTLILSETPWVRDAQSDSERKNRIANLFELKKLADQEKEIINRLEAMQNGSGAFPWFSGGRDNGFITQHILAGFGHLKKLGVEISASQLLKRMINFLDNDLLKREQEYKKRFEKVDSFYEDIYNAHFLYARSFFLKDYPLPKKVKEISDKIKNAQKENWRKKSLYNKALLASIFMRMNEKETAENILLALKESAVKSDIYGMYWKENERNWYWYTAPIETQALLIEAFSDAGHLKEVEEMKIWLLQNKRTNHWPTTKATTEACYALLMQGNDWLKVSDSTSFEIGGKPIPVSKLSETKKEAGTGYMRINWQAGEISESLADVQIENNNTTAGYGGIYWQYFEDLDKIKTHDQGPLNVEKELYLNTTGKSGKILSRITTETPLKIGDLVTVRLVVRTTADMDFIHLKDMRASGFEPTNVLSKYKYQDGTAYYESTKDASTHFFFDELKKGTYVLEYTVRANNGGNFSNGTTTIESMYAPEFSGHTKGIRVNITE